jgi:hypothetical protein
LVGFAAKAVAVEALPVTAPVTLPVRFPTNPVFAVIVVPVMAAGVPEPIAAGDANVLVPKVEALLTPLPDVVMVQPVPHVNVPAVLVAVVTLSNVTVDPDAPVTLFHDPLTQS